MNCTGQERGESGPLPRQPNRSMLTSRQPEDTVLNHQRKRALKVFSFRDNFSHTLILVMMYSIISPRGVLGGDALAGESSSDDQIPGTVPAKRARLILLVVIAGVAVIAILLIAFVATPLLNGMIAQSYVQNGDYVEYDISGQALFIPFLGTLRIDITNVTVDGFTAIITMNGIPGGDSKTIDYAWGDPLWADLEYGSKVGTEQITTPWGLKTVDKYFLQNGTENTTTYMGNNPEIIYRVDMTSPEYSMTMVMTDTNIDIIKNENG